MMNRRKFLNLFSGGLVMTATTVEDGCTTPKPSEDDQEKMLRIMAGDIVRLARGLHWHVSLETVQFAKEE